MRLIADRTAQFVGTSWAVQAPIVYADVSSRRRKGRMFSPLSGSQ